MNMFACRNVTLRHAGRLNAMSRGMWRQLRAMFEDIQQRSDVRCVIVAGEGSAFCAGGDISEYPGFRFDAAALRDFHENDVWGGLNAMLSCDVPVVAQISGACMGAGVEIASCCDVRIAGSSARFGAPITGRTVRSQARAQWVRARAGGGFAVGLELVEPSPEIVAEISRFVTLMNRPAPIEADPESGATATTRSTFHDTPGARGRGPGT